MEHPKDYILHVLYKRPYCFWYWKWLCEILSDFI